MNSLGLKFVCLPVAKRQALAKLSAIRVSIIMKLRRPRVPTLHTVCVTVSQFALWASHLTTAVVLAIILAGCGKTGATSYALMF